MVVARVSSASRGSAGSQPYPRFLFCGSAPIQVPLRPARAAAGDVPVRSSVTAPAALADRPGKHTPPPQVRPAGANPSGKSGPSRQRPGRPGRSLPAPAPPPDGRDGRIGLSWLFAAGGLTAGKRLTMPRAVVIKYRDYLKQWALPAGMPPHNRLPWLRLGETQVHVCLRGAVSVRPAERVPALGWISAPARPDNRGRFCSGRVKPGSIVRIRAARVVQ